MLVLLSGIRSNTMKKTNGLYENFNKHLTIHDRKVIEQLLNDRKTFSDIADSISKHPTTISREVKKHRVISKPSSFNHGFNLCKHKYSCKLKNICPSKFCNDYCKHCYKCNLICSSFTKNICDKSAKPPYVCNGCDKFRYCRFEKYMYLANNAQSEYNYDLVDSRSGINLTPLQLNELDNLITPLIKNGLSLNHILANNSNSIDCSLRTLYNYIEKGYITATNLDLIRKVKYKKRKGVKPTLKKEAACRSGRTYIDFNEYRTLHPEKNVVEMDLVEGKQGGKVLLTLFFRNSDFMLAFILDNKTSENVSYIFNLLHRVLGTKCFKKTFPIILTDNGPEFSNPSAIERDDRGRLRTKVFFCNPLASWQKAMLEHNHIFIRYILPKGSSFELLTQDDVTFMINNINSVSRASLNNKTPFDIARMLISKKVLEKLNLKKIPANEIVLKPKLLKKR